MRAAFLLLAVSAALAAAASAPAGTAACSRSTANAAIRAAIRAAKPHVPSLAGGSVLVTPKEVDGLLCLDFTRDGRTDLAFTVASGGTAGDVAWVALARAKSGWRVVHSQGGYKLGLYRVGTDSRRLPAGLQEDGSELLSNRRLRPHALALERHAPRPCTYVPHLVVPPLGRDSHLSTSRRTRVCLFRDDLARGQTSPVRRPPAPKPLDRRVRLPPVGGLFRDTRAVARRELRDRVVHPRA